jgi:chitin synthase
VSRTVVSTQIPPRAQFVPHHRLFGTIVLPVAVCLTYALIINTALRPPTNFQEAIPVILLVGVLGLPAILVLITTRRVVYVGWMVIYLLSLPIWNFVLPAYSFIKMDGEWSFARDHDLTTS